MTPAGSYVSEYYKIL